MRKLLPLILENLGAGKPLALATVVSRKGSAPRGRGARLLADENGLVAGTVGGGGAEAAVLEGCVQVLRTGRARLLGLSLNNAGAAEGGMVCGGEVRVFMEFLSPDPETRELFETVAGAAHSGGVFITRFAPVPEPSPERFVYAGGVLAGLSPGAGTGGPLPEALRARGVFTEPAVLVCGGKEYFAEPLCAPDRMIIAGAGHVAVPTAELAAFAGFAVHVLDDRPEFVRRERFPKADSLAVVPEFADCLSRFAPDARTHIVIITRGHLYDGAVLAEALRTEAGYIGMIGSRKKRESVFAAMRESGFGERDLARVHCPIGLAIGAETPEEIALSILAECVAHKRR